MKWLCAALLLCLGSPAAAQCYRAAYAHQAVVAPIYYQVGSALREEAIAELAAQKMADKLKDQYAQEIAGLRQQLSAALSGKICVEFGAGNNAAGAPSTAAGNPSAAQAVVDQHCKRCHSGPGARGKLDLSDLSALDELRRYKVEFNARAGLMPPKGEGEPISDADAQILQAWLLRK